MGRIAEALKKAERERTRYFAGPGLDRFGTPTESIEPDHEIGQDRLGGDVSSSSVLKFGQHGSLRFSGSTMLGPPPPWDVHPTLVAVHDRSSTITEQYRAARTWLLRRNASGQRPCVAITSSVPREGKSVTTANLSVVMAEVRHLAVLAIDCDFRQGSLAKMFKMPNSPGLSDVLAGRATLEEAISVTPLGNLSVLTAGTSQDLNPPELLNSQTAARVFDEIRERYHYTLVDTPPVQWLSDIGVIGALCSGIVMVVRMNKTASHLVRQSVHWLQANNLNVLGCIAADCNRKGVRYEYEGSDDD